MKTFPIGVMLESFRLPIAEALEKAAALGVQGIQVYATRGELAPENLNPGQRRDFLKRVKDAGLVISAVCGDLGMASATRTKTLIWSKNPSVSLICQRNGSAVSSPPTSV